MPRIGLLTFLTLALAALVIWSPQYAYAEGSGAEETAQTTFLIPFAPPLDTDLYFLETKTRERDGRQTRATVKLKLRFSKAETGYRMQFASVEVEVGGRKFDSQSPLAKLMPDIFSSSTYELSENGEILRISDWPAEKQRLNASRADAERLMKLQATDDQLVDTLLESTYGYFQSLTAEQAPAYFIKNWMPLLGAGGTEMVANVPEAFDKEVDVGGVVVPVKAEYTLSSKDDGKILQLRADRLLSKESTWKVMEPVFTNILQPALEANKEGRQKRAEMEAAFRNMQLNEKMLVDFDAVTGLPRKAELGRIIIQDGEETPAPPETIRYLGTDREERMGRSAPALIY